MPDINDEQFRKSQAKTGNTDNARILKEDAEKNAEKEKTEKEQSVKVSGNERLRDQE